MILLEKRRLLFVVSMVFISLFTYLFTLSYTKDTIETVSLPATGKVVVLDAGHGRRRWWSKFSKWNNRSRY